MQIDNYILKFIPQSHRAVHAKLNALYRGSDIKRIKNCYGMSDLWVRMNNNDINQFVVIELLAVAAFEKLDLRSSS